jgi:putative salt-induced outer membrane protein YdiY
MLRTITTTFALTCALAAATARADDVIFSNGDRVTGTIKSLDGGKLKIDTKVGGEITVDLKDVQTFSTDAPIQIRLNNQRIIRAKIAPAAPSTQPATQPVAGAAEITADGTTIPLQNIKRIMPKQAWTGSILANGNVARGNTHSEDFGITADAALRRDDAFHNDRFSLGGAYNFGRQTVGGVNTTSADNWFAQAKYDRYFTDKWYGYGLMRYDHDRLAFLNYRLSPGVGVGYQWFEGADFNLRTEAGASYVYEDYSSDGNSDKVALRLAYHVDKTLNQNVSVFHNLEWLPAFDDPGDYNLNADAGIRAKLAANFFSEFKVQYQRDSTPAPGALKNDVRFIVGLGWTF